MTPLKAYNSVGGRILKNWHISTEDNTHVCALATGNLSPELEHKLAQLIAAAPELAEALKEWATDGPPCMTTIGSLPPVKSCDCWVCERTRSSMLILQKAGVTL